MLQHVVDLSSRCSVLTLSPLRFWRSITKTCLYNFDPLKSHFYIVTLGLTGAYINFLISAQNIDCGYSLEPPRRGGSKEYPQSMFWAEIWKDEFCFFYLKIFVFWRWNFFYILNRRVFVMTIPSLNVNMSFSLNRGFSQIIYRMANSVDLYGYEPSYLDLHCLQSDLCRSTELKD